VEAEIDERRLGTTVKFSSFGSEESTRLTTSGVCAGIGASCSDAERRALLAARVLRSAQFDGCAAEDEEAGLVVLALRRDVVNDGAHTRADEEGSFSYCFGPPSLRTALLLECPGAGGFALPVDGATPEDEGPACDVDDAATAAGTVRGFLLGRSLISSVFVVLLVPIDERALVLRVSLGVVGVAVFSSTPCLALPLPLLFAAAVAALDPAVAAELCVTTELFTLAVVAFPLPFTSRGVMSSSPVDSSGSLAKRCR
jgi:hypothetical protein